MNYLDRSFLKEQLDSNIDIESILNTEANDENIISYPVCLGTYTYETAKAIKRFIKISNDAFGSVYVQAHKRTSGIGGEPADEDRLLKVVSMDPEKDPIVGILSEFSFSLNDIEDGILINAVFQYAERVEAEEFKENIRFLSDACFFLVGLKSNPIDKTTKDNFDVVTKILIKKVK